MRKLELISAIIVTTSVVMNYLLIPGSSLLMIVSVLTLSLFYFAFSAGYFNGITFKKFRQPGALQGLSIENRILTIGSGFFLSVTLIGILFKILMWPGNYIMLMAGSTGIVALSVFCLMYSLNSKNKIYRKLLLRLVVIGVFGLFLFLTPKYFWLELKYKDYPDYVEAKKKFMENPENKELESKALEEYLKTLK